MFPPSSARSTSCSGRLIANGRPPPRRTASETRGFRLKHRKPARGKKADRKIPGGSPAGGGDPVLGAAEGAGGGGAAEKGNGACRAVPGKGKHPGPGGRPFQQVFNPR